VFLVTFLTINGSATVRFERNFGFYTALCTNHFMHLSTKPVVKCHVNYLTYIFHKKSDQLSVLYYYTQDRFINEHIDFTFQQSTD
jgi:hypothetical protein